MLLRICNPFKHDCLGKYKTLRSFKSSEHFYEKVDGPYCGLGYFSSFSDPINLASWTQKRITVILQLFTGQSMQRMGSNILNVGKTMNLNQKQVSDFSEYPRWS